MKTLVENAIAINNGLTGSYNDLTDADKETIKNSWSGKRTKASVHSLEKAGDAYKAADNGVTLKGELSQLKSIVTSIHEKVTKVLWETEDGTVEVDSTASLADLKAAKEAIGKLAEAYITSQNAYAIGYSVLKDTDFGEAPEAPKTRGNSTAKKLEDVSTQLAALTTLMMKQQEAMAANAKAGQ